MNIIVYTAIFIISALGSFFATRALIPILKHYSILDTPNESSSHKTPTVRGGGLALILVTVIIWITIVYDGFGQFELKVVDNSVKWIIVATVILSLISWFDDLKGLNPFLRLAIHFLLVIGVIYNLPDPLYLFNGLFPLWLDNVFIVLLWVWFINLFNFMDGIDGISGVEIVTIGLGVFLVTVYGGVEGSIGILALSLSGVGVGFLFWNWAPAKIFMGDVGSVPIGFLLAWLLLKLAADGYWVQAIIIPGYYIADTTITLFRRAFKGEKIWLPHRDHYYQQAVHRGLRHSHISSIVAITNIFLVFFAILFMWFQIIGLIGSIVIIISLLLYMRNDKRI